MDRETLHIHDGARVWVNPEFPTDGSRAGVQITSSSGSSRGTSCRLAWDAGGGGGLDEALTGGEMITGLH